MSDDKPNGMVLKPHFTRRIDLGHILQAGVIVVTVLGAMTGTYLSIQGRLTVGETNTANQQLQIIELNKRIQQVQDDQRVSSKDIAAALIKLSDQLVDLRVLVAGNRDGIRK